MTIEALVISDWIRLEARQAIEMILLGKWWRLTQDVPASALSLSARRHL